MNYETPFELRGIPVDVGWIRSNFQCSTSNKFAISGSRAMAFSTSSDAIGERISTFALLGSSFHLAFNSTTNSPYLLFLTTYATANNPAIAKMAPNPGTPKMSLAIQIVTVIISIIGISPGAAIFGVSSPPSPTV